MEGLRYSSTQTVTSGTKFQQLRFASTKTRNSGSCHDDSLLHCGVCEPSSALQLSGRAAPFFRSGIRDGLRKSPIVAGKALDAVLTLPVRVIRGFPHNVRPTLPGEFAMAIDVFHPNHHVCARRTFVARFLQNDGSVPHDELCAMAAHSNSQSKAEHITKPLGGLLHVGIDNLRN